MSYHVTILKTENGDRVPLSQEAVGAAVKSLAGLTIVSETLGSLEVQFLTSTGSKASLIWQDGEVWTQNPEPETLSVMMALAERLHARVRGDEFETYRTLDATFTHPDDEATIAALNRIVVTSRKRQWKFNAIIFAIFLFLALLIAYLSRG